MSVETLNRISRGMPEKNRISPGKEEKQDKHVLSKSANIELFRRAMMPFESNFDALPFHSFVVDEESLSVDPDRPDAPPQHQVRHRRHSPW